MATRRIPQWSRSRTYAVLGAALAMGAPLGLLLVEALLQGASPMPGWVMARFREEPATYLYLSLSTTLVFSLFGWIVGRKSDQLDATSLTDALTGLGNRRQFDLNLGRELARAGRYHTPLALLLIDVDGLKDINDRGGHPAGDIALRRVAEAIKRTARKTDEAARVGGDEFALLAPETTVDAAVALAERIRTAVAEGIDALSVSIGIADFRDAPSLDAEALYQAADRALYSSKAKGRDRVSLSAPGLTLPRTTP